MPGVHVIDHPLAQHHLTSVRDVSSGPDAFRRHMKQLVSILALEATRDLGVRERIVQTPLCEAPGRELDSSVVLLPILRAGLAMVEPFLDLIPSAQVRHLGLYRDEETALPVQYYNRLPAEKPADVAFILDPMLATGGSATLAIKALRHWRIETILLVSIIASTKGVEAVLSELPGATVFVCAIDPELNDRKFIVPGLGDAGDRLFNTV
jgi:uracil phosphoribosyltransferase